MVDFSFRVPLEDKEVTDDVPSGMVVPDLFDPIPEATPPPAVNPNITPIDQATSDIQSRKSKYSIDINDKPTKWDFRSKLENINKETDGHPITQNAYKNQEFATKGQNSANAMSLVEELGHQLEKGRAIVKYGKLGTERRSDPSPEIVERIKALEKKLSYNPGITTTGTFSYFTSAFEVLGQIAEMYTSARFLGITGTGAAAGAVVGSAIPAPKKYKAVGATVGALYGAGLASTGAMALESYDVEGGAFYNEALNDGIPKDEAAVLSVGVGLINATLETISFGVATKPFRMAAKGLTKETIKKIVMSPNVRKIVATAIKQYGATIFTEVTTEVLQEIVNIVAEGMGRASIGKELATEAEIAARLEEIAVKTFKAMVVLGPVGPATRLTVDIRNSKKAQKNKVIINKIKEIVDDSELGQIDPFAAAEHVTEILNNVGHTQVYIPGEQLQAWVDTIGDPDMIEKLEVADQIEEAIFQGNDVSISADNFAQIVMRNESFNLIEDHIRLGQNSKTAFEAKEGEQDLQDEVREFDLEEKGQEEAAKQEEEIADLSEITQAEQSVAVESFFTSADDAGITPNKWLQMQKNRANNRNEAIRKQEDKKLKEEQRKLSKEWKTEEAKVRKEVEQSLNQEQVYKAFNDINEKQGDGSPGIRLNKQQVEDSLKEITEASLNKEKISLQDLPLLPKGRKIYNTSKKEDYVGLDTYANLYGYEDGRTMLEEFLETTPYNEAVKNETNRIMNERHSTMADKNIALKEARLSLLEADYGSILMDEVNILNERLGVKKIPIAMIKRMAKARIGEYKIKDISPNKFLSAMRINGRKAGIAIRKGKIKEALAFKFKQAMNQYMAVEANNIQIKLVAKRIREMRKGIRFKKKGEKLPVVFQEALTEFMTNINIRPKLSKKRIEKLKELLNRKDARPDIPLALLDEDSKVHYRDMTLDKFIEMYETYRDIRHKGLTENKMMLESQKQSRDEIAASVAELIRANLDPKKAKEDQTKWDRHKEKWENVATLLLYNADTLMLEFDGGKNQGVVYESLKGLYDRALSEGYHPGQIGYSRRSKKVAQELLNLYKVYSKKERKAFNKKLTIPGIDRKLTKNEIIAVLLNAGNQDNIDAMLESNQFTQEEIDIIRDFVEKKDLDFAQSVHNYLKDTLWDDISATEKRRRNYSPREVKAKAFTNRHGTYKGGYYPLSYDRGESLIPKHQDVQMLHDEAVYGSFVSHHTARGHTQARKGSGGQRVLLDIFVLNSHIDQVIYDLEVGDAVTDIWKMLSHKEVKSAFKDTGHIHKFDWLELWVRDITTDQIFSNNEIERSLRWIRSGYTTSKLGWNVGVALLQPLGLIQSSVSLGHKNMLWAIKTVMFSKQIGENSIYNFVRHETGFMDARATTWNKDISEAQRQFKFTILDKWTPGNSAQYIRDSFFWMIKSLQGFTDTVTWLAAKKKGMVDFNGNEVKARRYADRQVSGSQGSAIFGDRTNIERGTYDKRIGQTEIIRAFSVFISYFMAKTNIAMRTTKKYKPSFKNPAQGLRWTRDMLMLYTLEAYLVALIQNKLPDDDDEESFIKTLVSETWYTILGGIPFVRELASETQGFRGGGTISSIVKDGAKLYHQMEEGEIDEQLFMVTNNFLGVLFQYPAAQINKNLRSYIAKIDGEEVRAVEWLLGPKFDK